KQCIHGRLLIKPLPGWGLGNWPCGQGGSHGLASSWQRRDAVYFFTSSFLPAAGAPSFSLLILPLVLLMPVVSIEPSSLAPLVMPGFSMPVCGAGPLFC